MPWSKENPGAKAALLPGPPGIGKTSMAGIIAAEAGARSLSSTRPRPRNKGVLAELLRDASDSHVISFGGGAASGAASSAARPKPAARHHGRGRRHVGQLGPRRDAGAHPGDQEVEGAVHLHLQRPPGQQGEGARQLVLRPARLAADEGAGREAADRDRAQRGSRCREQRRRAPRRIRRQRHSAVPQRPADVGADREERDLRRDEGRIASLEKDKVQRLSAFDGVAKMFGGARRSRSRTASTASSSTTTSRRS